MLDLWEQLCKFSPLAASAVVIFIGGIAFAVVSLLFRRTTTTVSPSGQGPDGTPLSAKLETLAEEVTQGPVATYRETVAGAERRFELFAAHLAYAGVETEASLLEGDVHISTIYLRDLRPEFSEVAARNPYKVYGWLSFIIGLFFLSVAFYWRATSPDMEGPAAVFLLIGLIPLGFGLVPLVSGRRLPAFQFFGTGGDVLLSVGPFIDRTQMEVARTFCKKVQDQVQKVLQAEAERRG